MRAIEEAEVAAGRASWLGLMERACAGVAAAIGARFPVAGHAVVLCGPGNNGGDGYGTAVLLRAAGWRVEVFALGDPARQAGAAGEMVARWGDVIGPLTQVGAGARPDLMVDAVFGIGLSRAIPNDVVAAHRAVRHRRGGSGARVQGARVQVVAIDCPSGLDADTGAARIPDEARTHDGRLPMAADLTLTFHRAKPGQFLGQGPALCGALQIVPLGLETDRIAPGDWRAHRARRLERTRLLDAGTGTPGRLRRALLGDARHKYERGHALVLAGGVGRGGAGRMAARAALRAGAGLVTLGCPPAALIENAAQLNAVMLRPVAGADALASLLEDTRLSALCLGPGLGTGEGTRALVAAALDAGRATVLDADALTTFEDAPGTLFGMLHRRCVLTPHAGEFARLFPDLAPDAEAGRSALDAARQAAARAGCTVLLKGAATVIAAPDGRTALHAAAYETAVPWLATAGAGDVLAGIIAGLIARPDGGDPFARAGLAAWLHAAAARAAGPGLIAEDLSEAIPAVLRGAGVTHL
jgi:hydroxyethylthiazole kinase-like uncharacterized protein yjeF